MSLNNVSISGNLTRNAELKTAGNTQISRFSVAVNERRRNASGEWEDYPNYIDCIMFGARAEKLNQYLVKGTKVAIEGRLHQSRWQDESGNNRSRLELVVNELEFMSRNQQQPQHPQQPQQQPQQAFVANAPEPTFNDSDIPF